MNVLIVADHLDRSEAHLLCALAKRGFTLRCLSNPAAERNTLLRDAGITVEPLVCRGRIDPRAVLTIRRALRAHPADLVHSFTARGLTSALLATHGASPAHVAYRGTVGHLARWSPASRLSFLNRRIARLVCVSEAVRRYLLSLGVPEDRAVTIHKGHDVSWYAPSGAPADLGAVGIPRGAFVVGCTANARPVKGVDLLIEAAAPVMAKIPAMHLLLVGEMRDERIGGLIDRHPARERIHVTGYRSDAAALMGACELFVMPSRAREGLPKAAIEAMAQGVAPLVSDAGGLPELVLDGKCGWVCPAGDTAALSSGLEAAYADPARRRAFGAAARERIVNAFNIEQTIEKTAKVWQDAVKR